MKDFDLTYVICFLLVFGPLEIFFCYLKSRIQRDKTRRWVDELYAPKEPKAFNKDWQDDARYYILITLLIIYSFLGKHDIWSVVTINLYLIVNTIIHLSNRWTLVISAINNIKIDSNGVHLYNTKNGWISIYLMSMEKWFGIKIKLINNQLKEGIEVCERNRLEGLYYLDKIDVKFSSNEFISVASQAIYSNFIFLLHLLAVVVINSVLLFDMVKSGVIAESRFIDNVANIPYVILQVFSTVGFGDVCAETSMGKCFFIIMFIQVIVTIILGVVYKDFALNIVVTRFDEITKKLNDAFDVHKKICINSILTKKMYYNSFEEFQEKKFFFSRSVFDELKECVEQKDYGE